MGGMTYRTKKRLIMYSCALSVLILISFYVAGHGTKLFEVITVEDQVANLRAKRSAVFYSHRTAGTGQVTEKWLQETGHKSAVPKILIRSWKAKDRVEEFKYIKVSCDFMYKRWKATLFEINDDRYLISRFLPHYLSTYDAYPNDTYRANFSRYLYMYLFGGMYVNVDTDCLKPMMSYFDKAPIGAYIGKMTVDAQHQNYTYPIYWMASNPHNPFWLKVIKEAMLRSEQELLNKWQRGSDYAVGNLLFYDIVTEHLNSQENTESVKGQLHVLDSKLIYPLSFYEQDQEKRRICIASDKRQFHQDRCKQMYDGSDAYFLTYWNAKQRH